MPSVAKHRRAIVAQRQVVHRAANDPRRAGLTALGFGAVERFLILPHEFAGPRHAGQGDVETAMAEAHKAPALSVRVPTAELGQPVPIPNAWHDASPCPTGC